MDTDFNSFDDEMAYLDKMHQGITGVQPEKPKLEMAPLPTITPAPFKEADFYNTGRAKATLYPGEPLQTTPSLPSASALSPITPPAPVPTGAPAPVPTSGALKPIEPIAYKPLSLVPKPAPIPSAVPAPIMPPVPGPIAPPQPFVPAMPPDDYKKRRVY